DQHAACKCEWLRQRRKLRVNELPRAPLDAEGVGIVLVRVAAADTHDSVAVRDRDAVAQRSRELPRDLPFAVWFFQHERGIGPALRSAFPRLLVGEVGPARDDERAVADSRERPCEAFLVG